MRTDAYSSETCVGCRVRAGLLASVPRADRGVAAKQSVEFDVILVVDVRPAAAAGRGGGVETSRRRGVSGRAAVDTD